MKIVRIFRVTTILALCLVAAARGVSSAQNRSVDGSIHFYQEALKRNPRDGRTYYRLGDAYIQKARESGDPTYFNLAEQALRKSLELAPRNSGALRHLAYVLYFRHEFDEAASHAQKAIALAPLDSNAYGILGDAYLETGRYRQAEQTYQQMIGLRQDLYTYSRLSGLKNIRGDIGGAIADLENAVAEGKGNGRPGEGVAWVQWQLGDEHFAAGHLGDAKTQYLNALETYPNYYRALAGLAQVSVAEKRYEEAIELYKRAIAVIPQPDYIAALADVYKKIGRGEEAERQYALVETIGYLSALNKVLYNRELAYFYADHDMKLAEALNLAQQELAVRKDIYGYDVLAWALYKNGSFEEARNAMDQALVQGTKDARLFFHAGMIYYRLGETAKAKEFLARALATNPNFHIFHAGLAERTLKELNQQSSRVADNGKSNDY